VGPDHPARGDAAPPADDWTVTDHALEGSFCMPNGNPNIVVIWGDDIGITNLSCYSHGVMGYRDARTSTGSPARA
jgi:hypothetical protein